MAEGSTKSNFTDDTCISKPSCPLASCQFIAQDKNLLRNHYFTVNHLRNLINEIMKFFYQLKRAVDELAAQRAEELIKSDIDGRLSTCLTTLERVRDHFTDFYITLDVTKRQINDVRAMLKRLDEESERKSKVSNALKIVSICLTQEVTSIKQKCAAVTQTHRPNGVMIWRIDGVQEKTRDAQSERQTSIYSPPFYSSPCGYKLCVRLYLNGDGAARGYFASIFLVILRGPFDPILEWPFLFRVSFCLMDQRTISESNGLAEPQHIIQSFRPDRSSISFIRPPIELNIASGIPQFVRLDQLDPSAETNRYVMNDTMFIKTWIDFIGVPREMLPFIFNLDAGLPAHIQEKSIQAEKSRRAIDTDLQ